MCIRFFTVRRSVFVKSFKEIWDICGLILFKLLIMVHLLLIYGRHWSRKWEEDSKSIPQLQRGFNVSSKLCLNLRFRKWFKPRRRLVTSFIPIIFWQPEKLFGGKKSFSQNVCVCMCVFVLCPLLFPYRGGKTWALSSSTSWGESVLIQKPSVQIPKPFHQHGTVEKTTIWNFVDKDCHYPVKRFTKTQVVLIQVLGQLSME